MSAFLHYDEAKSKAIGLLSSMLSSASVSAQVLLIVDLTGKLRLIVWGIDDAWKEATDRDLSAILGDWWTKEIHKANAFGAEFRRSHYDPSWDGAERTTEPRLRILDRHRSRTGWFLSEKDPVWPWKSRETPAVVVFYSFKGGLGRTTALASFAIRRARAGERVCIVDLDLDSPGIGRLLTPRSGELIRWGVVDFLLERSNSQAELSDYFHRCDHLAGDGSIEVFPAGKMDDSYPDKLARVDFEESEILANSGIGRLLERIRLDGKPEWILLDARTGFADMAGRLLSGFAHLHVLLGTNQEQSWEGLNVVLDRMGRNRLERGDSQAPVLMLQAMAPWGDAGKLAELGFLVRSDNEFRSRYYCEDDSDENWDLRDAENSDAPHRPVVVRYDSQLAAFSSIEEVVDVLVAESGSFALLDERILGHFAPEGDA